MTLSSLVRNGLLSTGEQAVFQGLREEDTEFGELLIDVAETDPEG